jgi:ABC-2 type transport system permease protein
MSSRSFRLGGFSALATAIAIAIAVMVNVFMGALPANVTQIDTSASKLSSTSPQTESVASGLKDDVDIYWIVQSGAEDPTLETLLNRYKSLSGKIKITKKDPDIYPTFAKEYTDEQISNNSLVVAGGDRSKYIAYDGGIYEYDYTDYYTTGSYDVQFAGEGALTSAISYVTNEDLPKMYLLEGHGEAALGESLAASVEGQNVETASLSLVSSGSVPDDADCVLISAPQTDISEAEKESLLAYLKNGGRLLLITDAPEDSEGRPNIEALMREYGVTAEKGIVIETDQNNYASGEPYYLLPNLGAHEITTPLADEGYRILLPVAQGLTVGSELRDGLAVSELLATSDQAYSKIAGYALQTYEKEDGDNDGPFALGVAVTDTNTGAAIATDSAVASGSALTTDTAVASGSALATDAAVRSEGEAKETKLVWISSASVLDESVNTQISGANYELLLNAIGWMCEQEDAVTIRAKSIASASLTVPSGVSSLLSALFIVIIPAVVLAAGIFVVVRRRRR